MCGIAGIVKMDPRKRVEEKRLHRMREILVHRGPDGAGTLLDGPAGLAHRRLAIVDVKGGHQPMPNEDRSVWIVFNGEIYNHASLRPELERQGHRYRSRSDTETILHLYEQEGDRCVEKLQGMFAFAIWDSVRGRLLLARDRLGIKPLYYSCTDEEIVFASEIKAILAEGSTSPRFNRQVLPEFLATRFVSGEETFFSGVRKLLPGRMLTWSVEEGIRQRRYWQLPLDTSVDPDGKDAGEVRSRLDSAVTSHLMSDVPLGVFLSGGLDSTALAALMAPQVNERLKTFSVGFAESSASELPWARLAASAVGSDHHEVILSAAEFFDSLPRLVWHEDEPIAFSSSIPLYFVSRLASRHVKVVLTGEGADELFLGYNRYRLTAWNERLGRLGGRLLPRGWRSVARLLRRLPGRAGALAARSFLSLADGPRSQFYENFAVFPEVLQRRLLVDSDLLDSRDPYLDSLRCYDNAVGGPLDRMGRADLQTYLVELLMKQDQMSMATSIESRVPYLDTALVEHVVAIPGRQRLPGFRTKALLRDAARNLVPSAILNRRKMGFPVPLDEWLRGQFWPVVEDMVLGPRAASRGLFDPQGLRHLAEDHRSGAANHAERLWLLINLEQWQRIFIDGEMPVSLPGGSHA
ncbi:MAG TPA: asparagine synthase (glutamine-hydrolyzing) [Patescibacteria group bacterium]|nr:asparagine synthase (glutamine-hydrolyzing) [Patescibacteria group bacterium]